LSESSRAYVRGLVPRSGWQVVPGLADLRRYDRPSLRPDLVAAVAVSAVAIPASLGYADLAGLPVVVGLYAAIAALVGYAVFGSSRQLIVGPEGALAALTAVTIAPLAGGDSARYAALAAGLALLMGLYLLAGSVIRLGFMADFFSRPILLGYVNGIALTIIANQVDKMLGLDVVARDFFAIVVETLEELDEIDWRTALLSACLLAVLLVLRRFAPRVPGSLVVVALAIVLSELLGLADKGIAVVGSIEGGPPSIGLPDLDLADIDELALAAAAFALVALADTIATARSFAERNAYDVDANRELAGLGGANVASSLVGGFPVAASGSRTAVADSSGARSQVVGLATAAIVLVVLLFLTPLIEELPAAALAVVIVGAALSLFELRDVWGLRHVRHAEVVLSVAATIGVLVFGVLGGVALAIAFSIGVFVHRMARPHDAVLGRVDDIDSYRDLEQWVDAQTVAGLVVYRFDAPVFFPNAEYFRRRVLELVDRTHPPPRLVVLNADSWTYVDTTAISMLRRLRGELAERGVTLAVARAKARLREVFRDTGFLDELGEENLFPTVRAAAAALEARSSA
jgi:SulP family sulfate permease